MTFYARIGKIRFVLEFPSYHSSRAILFRTACPSPIEVLRTITAKSLIVYIIIPDKGFEFIAPGRFPQFSKSLCSAIALTASIVVPTLAAVSFSVRSSWNLARRTSGAIPGRSSTRVQITVFNCSACILSRISFSSNLDTLRRHTEYFLRFLPTGTSRLPILSKTAARFSSSKLLISYIQIIAEFPISRSPVKLRIHGSSELLVFRQLPRKCLGNLTIFPQSSM